MEWNASNFATTELIVIWCVSGVAKLKRIRRKEDYKISDENFEPECVRGERDVFLRLNIPTECAKVLTEVWNLMIVNVVCNLWFRPYPVSHFADVGENL